MPKIKSLINKGFKKLGIKKPREKRKKRRLTNAETGKFQVNKRLITKGFINQKN